MQDRYLPKEQNIKANLNKHFQNFINSTQGTRKIDDKWLFSELFQWYEHDFIQWTQARNLCEYFLNFAQHDDLKSYLEQQLTTGCNLEFFDYDWSLNASKK